MQTQQQRNYNNNNSNVPAIVIVNKSELQAAFSANELASLAQMGMEVETLIRWKSQYAPEAPIEDYLQFIEQCIAYKVDPRKKRAYIVGRWSNEKKRNVFTFQMAIGGLLSRAQSTGEFEGFTNVEYCNYKGVWRDVWLVNDPDNKDPHTGLTTPYAVRVGVYRKGFRVPLMGTVYFHEIAYITTTRDGKKIRSPFWENQPIRMMEKCAKAACLREGFEDVAGGIYIPEEMHLANQEADYLKTIPAYDMATDEMEPVQHGEPAPLAIAAPVDAPSQEPEEIPEPVEEGPKNLDIVPTERELMDIARELGVFRSWGRALMYCYPNLTTDEIIAMANRELTPSECSHIAGKFREKQKESIKQ